MTDETIFANALEKPGAAERSAYLAEACPDPEQRGRVQGLLAALEKAGGFLERPAAGPGGSDFDPTRAFRSPGEVGDGPTRTQGEGEDGTDDALAFLAPAGRPDSLGRIDHYEVLEVLGRGGFGVVFRAFDEVLQRVVAVKVLSPSMAATSPARKRFLREARSAALIQHESVVRIFETGEAPLPYLVMEFVPGETLQDRLDRAGPLEVPEALRIARQVAEGLAAAHEKGLVHRDIKPSNVLIEAGTHRAKITDFGLARAADDASLTRSGVVAGTPLYMAPEQARAESLDHRADLFSLGSVAYAMLTGRPPFRAESTLAVLRRVADDTPRPIREIIPEVPEWLCRVVEKLHAKDPAERFQSAREVADLLADCERQLAAHKELRDASRIPPPAAAAAPPREVGWPAVVGAALLLRVPIAIMDETRAGTMSRWMAIPGACLMGALVAVIAVGVLQKLGWIDTGGRAGAAGRPHPTRRHLWRFAAVLWLVAILFWGAMIFGEPAYLYATDRGELELLPQDGLVDVIVLENPEGVIDGDKLHPSVTDWLGMKQKHSLKLPPGKYQLNAGLSRFDRIVHWEVTTSGPFGSRNLLVPGEGHVGWSAIVTVERGRRTTVRPVLVPGPPPAPQTDGRTIPDWGTAVDPKRDCQFERAAEGLTVTVPGGKHNLNPTPAFNDLSAPRVLRKAAGDFQADVRVAPVAPPGSPDDGYLGAGLLLWQDGRNFVRFLRAATANPRRSFLHFEFFRDGRLVTSTGLDAPDRPVALRAVRTGNAFRFYWSPDGGQWSEYAVGSPVGLSEALEVGVCAINTTGTPFAAGFSGLRLTPPAGDGWVQLFNGKDLTGWTPHAFPGKWEVKAGVLVLTGLAQLESVRDYRDFHLRASVRCSAGHNATLVFRAANKVQGIVGLDRRANSECRPGTTGIWRDGWESISEYRRDLVPAGEWIELELIVRGNRVKVTINGTTTTDATAEHLPGSGRFKLQEHDAGGVLEFRKIEIKELPPVAASGAAKATPKLAVLQPLRDAVAARGRLVADAKLRFEVGKVGRLEVLAAEVELCEAKIKLAEAEADRPTLVLLLRGLVKYREEERELVGVRVEAGVEPANALNQADGRLADARARLAKVAPPEVAPPPRPKP